MHATKIAATTRTEYGKGPSRRLRAAGKLPAVSYAKGGEAVHLVVSPEELKNVLTSDRGVNSVVELDLGEKVIHAMIRDYQYHPLSRKLLHADFIQVSDEETVEVSVPVHLNGKAKGIVLGGKLRQVFRELPLRCVPSKIPVEITHDITELGLDEPLHASDLNLPEGVEVMLPAKQTVAVIAMDRRAKAEEDAAAAADPKKGEAAASATK